MEQPLALVGKIDKDKKGLRVRDIKVYTEAPSHRTFGRSVTINPRTPENTGQPIYVSGV